MPRGAASSRPRGAWGRERNVPIASAPGVHGNICGWGEVFLPWRNVTASLWPFGPCKSLLSLEVPRFAPRRGTELCPCSFAKPGALVFPQGVPKCRHRWHLPKIRGVFVCLGHISGCEHCHSQGSWALVSQHLGCAQSTTHCGKPQPFFSLLILTPAGWVSRTVPGPWVLCPSGVLLPPPGLSILQGAEWCCWIPSCYLVPFWLLGPVTCGCLCRDFRPDSHAGGEAR